MYFLPSVDNEFQLWNLLSAFSRTLKQRAQGETFLVLLRNKNRGKHLTKFDCGSFPLSANCSQI